ncbi:MAG: hypothetical protein M1825_003787 [Sarcosagium campestre]|nr:MAG: hypothetical protein M1825_003787 [Sarcosagium campestre]
MQPLNSKESSLFRQVVRSYESKQYKKGKHRRCIRIKAADQILRKNPNHADTLAMKALILNCQGHLQLAFPLAKTALKSDMKSYVAWHVYGLLYRADKNVEEAAKAYKFALKLDPDSTQILRDLTHLQIQVRDYQGLLVSRRTALRLRSGLRQNWTALAVAHHLAGDLAAAENVLTTYEGTLKSQLPKSDLENSEAVMYKNNIIAEQGDIQRALEHLEAAAKHNLDRTAYLEARAKYLVQLDRRPEAEKAYRALLERNPENWTYYEGLERALGVQESDTASRLRIYQEYADKNVRGDAARRIPLSFLQGDEFRNAADAYLQRMLKKGVPSTFENIKALYGDDQKRATIEDLAEGYASGKGDSEANGSAEHQANGDGSKFKHAALYFLAKHYNYHLSRDLDKAMENINAALEHSPESVDLHMTKARIWKHKGHLQNASLTMEQARKLDERDRYINTKAAKYQLRNNENEAAIKTMSAFTRNEGAAGPLGDLHEMQCVWYITEDGDAYARRGNIGLALRRYSTIFKIFEVWQEDQFDFHAFSLKKGMVRAYVDLIRWEDRLREHPFYSRAAVASIKLYIRLYDNPDLARAGAVDGINGADGADGLNAAARKKALKKAKREQQKQEQTSANNKSSQKPNSAATGKSGDDPKEKDDKDYFDSSLAQTSEPLKDAMTHLSPLLDLSPKSITAQTTGFEVYIRREKYLLALKCLLAAHAVDASDPTLHAQIIRFKRTLDDLPPDSLDAKTRAVLESKFTIGPGPSTTLAEYNDAFLAAHASSARHIHAALDVRQLLDPDSSRQANEKDVIRCLDLGDLTLDEAIDGLKLLRGWAASAGDEAKSAAAAVAEYKSKARLSWSEATAFEET